jgi:F-type H+-transporting ATPase subunit b
VIIEWFTVIAQIINFLILLFLMRRFLYKPILNMMDERERHITLRLREAEESIKEADEAATEYQDLKSELEGNRESLLQSARQEAEEKRLSLLREARQEVERAQAAWNRAVRQEKEALVQELNQRASRQMIEMTRRALADLADKDLEEHIISVFLNRLKDLDENERLDIARTLQNDTEELLIRTAFDLTPEQQENIRSGIKQAAGKDGDLRFVIEPGLLGGIELKTRDRKISWSLSSYLHTLEESLTQAMQEKTQMDELPEQVGLDV